MTHIQPDFVHDSDGGVQRRTLVAGAAWTIPVVATAIGAPLAAASLTDELEVRFEESVYGISSCGPLKGVRLFVTTSTGAPAPANTPVTVTLPTGLAFGDGTTTKILPANDGSVTLPDVFDNTPGAGQFSIAASLQAPSTATAMTSVEARGGSAYDWNSSTRTPNVFGAVPAGSTSIGAGFFLSGTNLYFADGTLVSADAGSATGFFANGTNYTNFVTTAGVASDWTPSRGTVNTFPAVPSGSTSIGAGFYQIGSTIYFADGTLIATGVTSATGVYSGTNFVNWVDASGTAYDWAATTRTPRAFGSVAPGSTSVGSGFFQNGTTLYYADGTIVATNVETAVGLIASGTNIVNYLSTDGTTHDWNAANRVTTTFAGVPLGATPVSSGFFLSGTNLYYADGTLIATEVSSATGVSTNINYANYVRSC